LLWSVCLQLRVKEGAQCRYLSFLDFYPPMSAALVPLASLAQIEKTPSREDGLAADLEDDLKAFGCKLIHQAGILLKQFVLFFDPPTRHPDVYILGSRWQ